MGQSPFRSPLPWINRAPAILGPPTEYPSGENASLYGQETHQILEKALTEDRFKNQLDYK